MAQCYNCSTPLVFETKPPRSAECPSCRKDVRVCFNCKHYDPGAWHACKEAVPDEVTEKDRGNFCDWFTLADQPWALKTKQKSATAKSSFNALFND